MNRLKKILGYSVCFSIFWSNIAWAGKEFLDQQEDSPKPLVSIKPHTLSSSRDIDSLHLFESGEVVAEDVQGKRTKIPNYQQPRELQEAIQGGYVDALINNLNLYIRQSGDDLKLELMGGLKGGMFGGDNQGAYNPQTGQVIQKPTLVIRPTPQPVPKPQPVAKPDYNWSKTFNQTGFGGGGPFNIEKYSYQVWEYENEKRRQEKKQREYEQYLKQEQAHQQYLKEKQAHEEQVKKQQLEVKLLDQYGQTLIKGSYMYNVKKSTFTKEALQLWQSKLGQPFTDVDHVFGYNLVGAVSIHNKLNGLSYPLFYDDRRTEKGYFTAAFLPNSYTYNSNQGMTPNRGLGHVLMDKMPIHILADTLTEVTTDTHNPIKAVLMSKTGNSDDTINAELTFGLALDSLYHNGQMSNWISKHTGENQQALKEMYSWMYLYHNPVMDERLLEMPLGGFGRSIEKKEIPQYIQDQWVYKYGFKLNKNGHISIVNKMNDLPMPIFDQERQLDGAMLPYGYQHNPEHEQLGLRVVGSLGSKAIDIIDGVIGVPKAHAGGLKLAIGGGIEALELFATTETGKWAFATVGSGLSGLIAKDTLNEAVTKLGQKLNWNVPTPDQYAKAVKTGVETLITVIDWTLLKPIINSTPRFDQEKLNLLVTEGIVGNPKIETFPANDGTGNVGIKLTTPVLDQGLIRQSIINMQVTREDLDKVNETGLKGPYPADNDDGLKWSDGTKGNNVVRVMNGKPNAEHESQREDYVKVVKDGKTLDTNGNEVKSGDNGFAKAKDNPRAHIKKTDWHQWRTALEP